MRIITRNNLGKNVRYSKSEKIRRGLSLRKVDDYLRFVIFLCVIGLLYVWNSHYAERQVKMVEALEVQVESLKARYLLKQSTLTAGTRLSEIKEVVDTLQLRQVQEPVYKLVRGKTLADLEPVDPELIELQNRRTIEERR
jgi:hypothetical protein